MAQILEEFGQQAAKADTRGFAIKCLNIRDPLLASNNLGRSVNKASYLRIRKAFRHGAKTLGKILLKVRRAVCWGAGAGAAAGAGAGAQGELVVRRAECMQAQPPGAWGLGASSQLKGSRCWC